MAELVRWLKVTRAGSLAGCPVWCRGCRGALGQHETPAFMPTGWFTCVLGAGFPFGTLFVNMAETFGMAVIAEPPAVKLSANLELRAFPAVGLLGSFTTSSGFSRAAAVLHERGHLPAAGSYTGASVAVSLPVLLAGPWITRDLSVKWSGDRSAWHTAPGAEQRVQPPPIPARQHPNAHI